MINHYVLRMLINIFIADKDKTYKYRIHKSIKKLRRVSIIYHNPAHEDHLSDALCTCRVAEYDVLSITLLIFLYAFYA